MDLGVISHFNSSADGPNHNETNERQRKSRWISAEVVRIVFLWDFLTNQRHLHRGKTSSVLSGTGFRFPLHGTERARVTIAQHCSR
jgi:hypothetical protein